jgi:hypothetical protein
LFGFYEQFDILLSTHLDIQYKTSPTKGHPSDQTRLEMH